MIEFKAANEKASAEMKKVSDAMNSVLAIIAEYKNSEDKYHAMVKAKELLFWVNSAIINDVVEQEEAEAAKAHASMN